MFRSGIKATFLWLLFLFVTILVRSGEPEKIFIGEKITFKSELLKKDMKLSIHVPAGFKKNTKKYPVLYTFQTHFHQVSGAVMDLYSDNLIPEMIVVSVDNYEYGYLSPTELPGKKGSGQADLFLDFFKKELHPYMEKQYQVQPYKLMFSNSWGAMFGIYSILTHPDVFNGVIASIPWIPYDGKEHYILKNTHKFLKNATFNHFLYLTMDNETEILEAVEAFVNILKNTQPKGLQWQYHHWPEEDHTSTPYFSIYSGLRAAFSNWNTIPENVIKEGVTKLAEHEKELNSYFGYSIGISPYALVIAAETKKNNKEYDAAVSIYKYTVIKNPEYIIAYVNLGRVYEAMGKQTKALESFEIAYSKAENIKYKHIKWVKNKLDQMKKKIQAKPGP